jgi:hypothetical protein
VSGDGARTDGAAPEPGPRTLFDKVWDAHVVAEEPGCPAVLYIDFSDFPLDPRCYKS